MIYTGCLQRGFGGLTREVSTSQLIPNTPKGLSSASRFIARAAGELVDVSLVAIAEYNADTKRTAFSIELGELYYNRMLRFVGIKQYEAQLTKVLESASGGADQAVLEQPALTTALNYFNSEPTVRAVGFLMCAKHVQQLGGESPLPV